MRVAKVKCFIFVWIIFITSLTLWQWQLGFLTVTIFIFPTPVTTSSPRAWRRERKHNFSSRAERGGTASVSLTIELPSRVSISMRARDPHWLHERFGTCGENKKKRYVPYDTDWRKKGLNVARDKPLESGFMLKRSPCNRDVRLYLDDRGRFDEFGHETITFTQRQLMTG